jgi:hypothetical protein
LSGHPEAMKMEPPPRLFSHPCLEGILGSSASGGGTLQRKEGYVILLLPHLPGEALKLLHQGGAEASPPSLRSLRRFRRRGTPKRTVGIRNSTTPTVRRD